MKLASIPQQTQVLGEHQLLMTRIPTTVSTFKIHTHITLHHTYTGRQADTQTHPIHTHSLTPNSVKEKQNRKQLPRDF